MNKLKIGIFTLLLLMCISVGSYSQSFNVSKPNFFPPPPEAAALFKSVDIPVNLTTGLPNITIPIYEIRLNDFTLPLSLGYNSSGIRTDEIASQVGLGWSLNAGGMISSSVSGSPDLEGTGYVNSPVFPYDRDMVPEAYLDNDDFIVTNSDYDLLKELTGNIAITVFGPENIAPGPIGPVMDTQPDLFYYSFGSQSGKFFFTQDGSIHTVPYSPIKIAFNNGFTITDESGHRYIFEKIEINNITVLGYSDHPDFGGGNSTTLNHTYYLSRIETVQGNIIEFTYSPVSYSYEGKTEYVKYWTSNALTGDFPANVETRNEIDNKIFGERLTSIKVNSQTVVEFLYETCPRLDLGKASNETGSFALDRIKINRGTQTEFFDFTYGYFNLGSFNCDTPASPLNYRLKLLSVQRTGEEPYVFTYYGNNFLPQRNSDTFDHWGYYSSNGGRYPFDESGIFPGGATRVPQLNNTKHGVLEKIRYPTKGVSVFDYELNEARDTLNTVNVVTTPRGASLYYSPGDSYQTVNFTISNSIAQTPITIMYNTTTSPAQADLRFDVTVTGPNSYWRQFQSVNGYEVVNLSLPNGVYTLTVEQVGEFEEGYASLFWYEQQINYSTTISNYQLGGLRVRGITGYDREGGAVLSSKHYRYHLLNNESISSGKISNKPTYSYSDDRIKRGINALGTGLEDKVRTYRVINSSSVLPLSGLGGYHVLYTDVIESDDLARTNGYTYYKYSFVKDLRAYVAFPATSPTSFNWMRGLPLEESVYKWNPSSNSFSVVSSKTYEYRHLYNDPFAFFAPPTQVNETHSLGLSIRLIAPQWLYSSTLVTQLYPAVFEISPYKLISSWTKLEKTTELLISETSQDTLKTEKKYYYDNPLHAQLSRLATVSSKNDSLIEYYQYPGDYLAGDTAINDMVTNGLISYPLETVKILKSGTSRFVLGGTVNQYKPGGRGLVDRHYTLSVPAPLASTSFKFSNKALGALPETSPNGNFGMDNRYVERVSYHSYDVVGNPTDFEYTHGLRNALLWDYNRQNLTAQCANCTLAELSVTSFETDEKGGWTYTGTPLTTYYRTGRRAYNLSSGAVSKPVTGATAANPYRMGFWARTVSGTASVNVGGQTESLTTAWKWVEKQITTSSLTISGTNIIIDELRLHPEDATVTSFTYLPLIGMTSQTDPNGQITYYEYDGFGRLQTIRDHEGNVLETYEYNYAKQD